MNPKTDSTQVFELAVEGMSCASCVNTIEKTLSKIPGIRAVSVNLITEKATVEVTRHSVSLEQVLKAVSDLGYQAQEVAAQKTIPYDGKKAPLLKERNRLIGAILLTLPLILPMFLMVFMIHWALPPAIQLFLASLVQFGIGGPFYRSAWKALQSKVGNMDLLVALGTSAAYGLSVFQLREGPLYFESSASVMTLVLLGKFLESKAKARAASALHALHALRPEKARVKRGGKESSLEQEIPVEQLNLGEIVIVKPGEKIPVDGVIREGMSSIDESLITGESVPVFKGMNQRVIGGSLNQDGLLLIETTALGTESTLARITRRVEEAQASKAPIQKQVDRVSGIFVGGVLVIAAVTLLGWGLYSHEWSLALIHSVSVLVIACPCALGLATPASILVGTGQGARAGILIQDPDALEMAHSLTVIAFDKTGTLTEGTPTVSEIIPLGMSRMEFLKKSAAVQAGSEHPFAKAVIREATEEGIQIVRAQEIRALPGKGVQGILNGKQVWLGNQRWMEEKGFLLNELEFQVKALQAEGKTISYLAEEGSQKVLGLIAFRDALRGTSLMAVRRLKQLGLRPLMITGDSNENARRVGEELEMDEVRAEVLPEDKAKLIEELKAQGEVVAMVGDGVNDGPALAAAHVGIAVGTGTDVALKAAGITLMRSDPLLIPQAIEISRQTYLKIKQNLFWAFIYNAVGIPLAAFGFLNPMVAGAAMALSSLSVVVNSLLLRGRE